MANFSSRMTNPTEESLPRERVPLLLKSLNRAILTSKRAQLEACLREILEARQHLR